MNNTITIEKERQENLFKSTVECYGMMKYATAKKDGSLEEYETNIFRGYYSSIILLGWEDEYYAWKEANGYEI